MAGKYGPASVTVTLEDAPGGTARSIHDFLVNGITAKQLAEFVETTGLGDTFREYTPTGIKTMDPITLEGWWDTTSTTGSHAVFSAVDDGPQDDGRELIITWGDSKRLTVNCRLTSYETTASLDGIHRFVAELRPTGTITLA